MKTLLSVTLLLAMASITSCRNGQTSQNSPPQSSPQTTPQSTPQSTPEVESKAKVVIQFETAGCPNKCAVYSLTIRADRSVEYEGKEFTRLTGKRTYSISSEGYNAILDAAKRAKVEQLAGEYKPVPGRDEGTFILRVSLNEKTKVIIHLLPSADAPDALIELEQAILNNAYPTEGRVPQ